MKIVLLNFSEFYAFEDPQDALAQCILEELSACVEGELTAEDIPPHSQALVEAISHHIVDSDILLTIGGLGPRYDDAVKHILVDGLSLETTLHRPTLERMRAHFAARGEALPDDAEGYATLPAIAEVLAGKGLIPGFALRSHEQLLLCLPDRPDELLPLLLQQGYPCLGSFLGRTFHTAALPAEGCPPAALLRALDDCALPAALHYTLARYAGRLWLRLLAPDEELLRQGMACAGTLLHTEPLPEESPLPAPPPVPGENSGPDETVARKAREADTAARGKLRAGAALLTLLLVALLLVALLGYAGVRLLGGSDEPSAPPSGSEALPVGGKPSTDAPPSDDDALLGENTVGGGWVEGESLGMPQGYLRRFADLYEQNNDLAGWLEVEGTDLAYPVVQSEDNDYYLRRNFEKEDDQNGIPFVDYRIDLKNPPDNTIIYGHNMRNGQMFEPLLQYRDLNFYREHPRITFDSVYGEAQYKVFAVFIANTRAQDGPIFDYLNFLEGSDDAFMEFIDEVLVRSLIETDVDVLPSDKILTLSTCTYEFTDARFVVMARQVREGEDPEVDVSAAKKAANPLMPDIWYQLYGGSHPLSEVGKEESAPPEVSEPESSAPEESSEPDLPEEDPPEDSSSEEEPAPDREPEEEEEEEEDDPRYEEEVADEILSVMVGGRQVKMNAYDLVSEIVENETHGQLHPEAIKAQVVATYTYVQYNNAIGVSPTVQLKSSISPAVKKAVDQVLGEACYYKGDYINAVYHSISCGNTASAKSVWGTNLPYLQEVDSPYDEEARGYESTFKIDEEDFADAVLDTYGIDLYDEDLDPEDWIEIDEDHMASGDYVGRVLIGGHSKSQGGSVGRGKEITGRNVRENLLGFQLRSTCFDVAYKNGRFVFTVRGYGHGVGMSQWGAHYMAEDGYDYEEILEHYYTDITVK